MKLSDGVEWGIHCCTVLAALPEGTALPAARLAEFHGVPAAYLAKHLQALSRAGIVTTEPGQRAEQAWRAELQATTLAGILADLASSVPPRAFEKAGAWFTEVLR